jgi:hypothetical protein
MDSAFDAELRKRKIDADEIIFAGRNNGGSFGEAQMRMIGFRPRRTRGAVWPGGQMEEVQTYCLINKSHRRVALG